MSNADADTQETIAETARRAFQEAGGDIRLATRIMEQAVRADRRLRDDLTAPPISNACYAAVRLQCRGQRAKVWSPSARTLAEGAERVRQLAANTLLAFPLPGGKSLAEATRAEIMEAAAFYEAQADDMTVKARWLVLVADAVPEWTTAGAVLTEKRLRALQAEARNHAA